MVGRFRLEVVHHADSHWSLIGRDLAALPAHLPVYKKCKRDRTCLPRCKKFAEQFVLFWKSFIKELIPQENLYPFSSIILYKFPSPIRKFWGKILNFLSIKHLFPSFLLQDLANLASFRTEYNISPQSTSHLVRSR